MVADEDGIVYGRAASASATWDKAVDMDVDTIFWITSATKASTVTACLQLIEQGKLSLATRPSGISSRNRSEAANSGRLFRQGNRSFVRPRVMTLRHLLTHTSGFAYNVWSDLINRYEKVEGPDISTCQVAASTAR